MRPRRHPISPQQRVSVIAGSGPGDTSIMQIDPQAGVTDLNDKHDVRRQGRLGQEAVVCDLGVVLDLSTAGMRLRCSKIPKDEFTTKLIGLGSEVTVKGRVVWNKRAGLFKKLCGIEFVDLTDQDRDKITRMGMTNRKRRTI